MNLDRGQTVSTTWPAPPSPISLGNGRWENTEFNSRLQPTKMGLGSGVASQSLLKLEYSYGTTQNNGNVVEQKITVPGAAHPYIQAYTYDELNRLATAEETKNSSQEWKQTFVYDRYGNRNFATTSGATTTLPSGFDPDIYNPTISTTNNRFSSGQGYSYDSSGNTTADAEGRTFVYDAENKQIEVIESSTTIGQYFYDGDGKRIKKIVPGGETTVFVYDAAGQQIAEYSTVLQSSNDAKLRIRPPIILALQELIRTALAQLFRDMIIILLVRRFPVLGMAPTPSVNNSPAMSGITKSD